jgi:hypothetical protein
MHRRFAAAGGFSGVWGDPFEISAGLLKELAPEKRRKTGFETVNGFATKIMETAGSEKTKVWLDTASGLVIRAQVGSQTVIEIKQLSLDAGGVPFRSACEVRQRAAYGSRTDRHGSELPPLPPRLIPRTGFATIEACLLASTPAPEPDPDPPLRMFPSPRSQSARAHSFPSPASARWPRIRGSAPAFRSAP